MRLGRPERNTFVSMADSPRHPFLHGLSKHRGAPPTVVVIFGASGDLTARNADLAHRCAHAVAAAAALRSAATNAVAASE